MKPVTPKQISKTVSLIAQSGIDSDRYQTFLKSGRLIDLLRELSALPDQSDHQAHPDPTIIPIKVYLDYTRTLVSMRDAAKCDGYVNINLNDENFPIEVGESCDRELVLVCFGREIDDSGDITKSELLREMDHLGLQPEGLAELCAVGECYPDLQREFPVVARRQVWEDPFGYFYCPILYGFNCERDLSLRSVHDGWGAKARFLASRKSTSRK